MSDPLVLVPGMMCDARLFMPQIKDLSRDMAVQVAAISDGATIREMASLVLAAAPERFALAGLSMGGIVAMEVLRRAPERVSRIAMMSTTPLAETPEQAAWREPQIVKANAGRLDEAMVAAMSADNLAPGVGRNAILHQIIDMAYDFGPTVFIRQSRALQRRPDAQKVLRQMKVPTLVLCGAHDKLTPVKRHEFMAELIPFAELEVIEDAGHLPTLEAPEQVNAALRRWMAQPLVLR
ncbi:alpha/beta fold hydrolase [Aliiroseovarius subalbicans]|uniref:alpha/beta fold hydrolase n=1 Tax=Aliiroseovarius subalbicans TaxID=2925840 RepID=UPI001F56066F|nr:alpha/beta fold hydrolase [Aliiroseovarius subalbicans]MCI2397888.1 alpha/beta hydrolase [Aliiroseovarius subalbicans]